MGLTSRPAASGGEESVPLPPGVAPEAAPAAVTATKERDFCRVVCGLHALGLF